MLFNLTQPVCRLACALNESKETHLVVILCLIVSEDFLAALVRALKLCLCEDLVRKPVNVVEGCVLAPKWATYLLV
jgi:hypothetical protein